MDRDGDRLQFARDEFLGELRREERRDLLMRKQIFYAADKEKNSSMDQENENEITPLLSVYGEMAQSLSETIKEALKEKPDNTLAHNYLQALVSGNLHEQHKAIVLIRKLTSTEVDEGCEALYYADGIPILIELAKRDDIPYLQMEANWTLANFCSRSEHVVRKVVERGLIPIFLQNVSKPSRHLAEQCVWGIGNLAADSQEYAEVMHSHNAVALLVEFYGKIKSDNKGLARQVIWSCSNLCRIKPTPALEKTAPAFDMFVETLKSADRDEVKVNCVWSLRAIVAKMGDNLEPLVTSGLMPKIVDLLHSSHAQIVQPALDIVGHLTSKRPDQTKELIKLGLVSGVDSVLSQHAKSLKQRGMMVLANVASGDSDDVEQILSCRSVLMSIFNFSTSDIPQLSENAIWVLGNMCMSGNFRQVERLLDMKLLEAVSHILHMASPTDSLLCMTLETLEAICKSAKDESERHFDLLMEAIEKQGMIAPLEKLQDSNSSKLYQKAYNLITTYFQTETYF